MLVWGFSRFEFAGPIETGRNFAALVGFERTFLLFFFSVLLCLSRLLLGFDDAVAAIDQRRIEAGVAWSFVVSDSFGLEL